ncbi:hypothetical protein [Kribbella sp. NPDC051620]|uniref:hypothetical protein n=1 Tax=Kribbella sp. NPDC051620 TaxID=3364120 RepID=UPI0037A70C42
MTMSRRREQEIRQYMSQHGVTFTVARRALSGHGPAATGNQPDGWPAASKDYVVGEVIDHLRHLVGNGLETSDAARVIENLLRGHFDEGRIAAAITTMGDVMVVSVASAPADFPLIQSGVVWEHEYGMTLEEVTLGLDAELEISLPDWAAAPLISTGAAATAYVEDAWVTVALRGVELECTAQLRVESEQAEITELRIGRRED